MSGLSPRLRAALLGVLMLVCAACVSIPDSSPVSKADNVGGNEESPPLSNTAPGPQPGADPAEIVNGFFQAMLSSPQSSAVARQFLTPAAAVSWDPRASTVVYTGPGVLTESGNVISVELQQLGSMDDRGEWSTAPRGAQEVISSLRLQKVDDEWRISNPEPGTFIDSDYFDRNYLALSLYFIDPTQQWLTPAPVHLVRGDATATTLVSDLLLGPSPELSGVATSAAPPGTHLDSAVSISPTGVAQVPLSSEFLLLNEDDRGLFAAQLAWTLRQLPAVEWVEIVVDGAPVKIEGVDQEFRVDAFAGRDPAGIATDRRLYALARTGLVAVEPTDVTEVSGPIGQVRGARSAAVNPNGQLGALVTENGRRVLVGGMTSGSDQTPTSWFDAGTSLLRPSWDQHGVLWLVDRTGKDGGARIWAVTEGRRRQIEVAGLTGEDIRSFGVSSDGVRLAALVRNGDTPQLLVAVIDRSADNAADVSLRAPQEVRPAQFTLSSMTDLAWKSPTSLAVLGNFPGGDMLPYTIAIDGSSIEAPNGLLRTTPTSLAAGANEEVPLAVGDAAGEIFGQTPDLSWERLGGAHRLRAPVYPG